MTHSYPAIIDWLPMSWSPSETETHYHIIAALVCASCPCGHFMLLLALVSVSCKFCCLKPILGSTHCYYSCLHDQVISIKSALHVVIYYPNGQYRIQTISNNKYEMLWFSGVSLDIAEDNQFTSLLKVQQHSKSSLYVDIFLVVSSKHNTDI